MSKVREHTKICRGFIPLTSDLLPPAVVDYMIKERLKDDGGAVLKLTEDNFDNILRVTPLALVEFFADWCPACQALEPHFFAAAGRYRITDWITDVVIRSGLV